MSKNAVPVFISSLKIQSNDTPFLGSCVLGIVNILQSSKKYAGQYSQHKWVWPDAVEYDFGRNSSDIFQSAFSRATYIW